MRQAKQDADQAERDLKTYQNNLKYLKSAATRIKSDDEAGRLKNEAAVAAVKVKIEKAETKRDNA